VELEPLWKRRSPAVCIVVAIVSNPMAGGPREYESPARSSAAAGRLTLCYRVFHIAIDGGTAAALDRLEGAGIITAICC